MDSGLLKGTPRKKKKKKAIVKTFITDRLVGIMGLISINNNSSNEVSMNLVLTTNWGRKEKIKIIYN